MNGRGCSGPVPRSRPTAGCTRRISGRIAGFLLLNPEFPHSIRFAASAVESALQTIASHSARGSGGRAERLAGRLHASLDYGQVDEILSDDPHAYLKGIGRQCHEGNYGMTNLLKAGRANEQAAREGAEREARARKRWVEEERKRVR